MTSSHHLVGCHEVADLGAVSVRGERLPALLDLVVSGVRHPLLLCSLMPVFTSVFMDDVLVICLYNYTYMMDTRSKSMGCLLDR